MSDAPFQRHVHSRVLEEGGKFAVLVCQDDGEEITRTDFDFATRDEAGEEGDFLCAVARQLARKMGLNIDLAALAAARPPAGITDVHARARARIVRLCDNYFGGPDA
jgi:hypothetical protein